MACNLTILEKAITSLSTRTDAASAKALELLQSVKDEIAEIARLQKPASVKQEPTSTPPKQSEGESTGEDTIEAPVADIEQPYVSENVAQLREKLSELNEDIATIHEYESGTSVLDDTADRLAKLEKEADKVMAALGLTETVGGRILNSAPPKRFKRDLLKGEKAVKLADYFSVKKVYNLLSDVKELFGKSFDAVAANVDLKPDEKVYFDGAKTLINNTKLYINDFVADGMDQSNIKDFDILPNTTKKRDATGKIIESYQAIHRLLLQGSPGNYTLPDEVVTVMAVAVNEWMVNSGDIRGFKRSPEDTNRLLGRLATDELTQEDIARVADVDGMTTHAANSIGAAIYKNIGLKVIPEATENRELLEAKMKLELGLLALKAMESNDLLSITQRSAVSIYGEDSAQEGVTSVGVFQFKDNGNALIDDKSESLGANTRFATKVLGVVSAFRTPKFKAPKKAREVKISAESGKYFDVADESVDAVNAQEAVAWEWNNEYITMYNNFIAEEDGRERFMALLGWKDPSEYNVELRLGINGKNAAIESNMQYLEEFHAQMTAEENTKLWFPWKFVKNGRFILDTNTFNPQGKKLHRFAIFSDTAVIDESTVNFQELAMAQAFGIDIDKVSEATALEQWKERATELEALFTEGLSDLEILEEALRKDTNKKSWSHDPEHTMAGIVEYAKYRTYVRKNKSAVGFESVLPLETDAVTSGYILKTLQMPLLDNVEEQLAKGGVYTKFTEDTGFGKEAEKPGFLDAYNTPADVMVDILKDTTKRLTAMFAGKDKRLFVDANKASTALSLGLTANEEIKVSRSFMKNPFMIFNYGSGISKIVDAIADDSIERLYTNIAMAPTSKEYQQFLEVIRTSGVSMKRGKDGWDTAPVNQDSMDLATKEVARLSTMPLLERLEYKIPAVLVENIRSHIKAGTGEALDETFNVTYKPYIDASQNINNSFTVMFRLFKAKLDIAVAAKASELGRPLSSIEVDTIINTMKESLPAIKTALSGRNDNSKVMIYKTAAGQYDTVEGEVSETSQGKVRLAPVGNKEEAFSGQAKAYKLIESYASGSVVPIHYIDGSIQTRVLNKFNVLGIHDANMFYAHNVLEGTKEYNKAAYDLSKDYSITAELKSSLEDSISNATADELKTVNAIYLKESPDKEEPVTVDNIVADMQNLDFRVQVARANLFSQDMRIEHAAFEGSHYNVKGTVTANADVLDVAEAVKTAKAPKVEEVPVAREEVTKISDTIVTGKIAPAVEAFIEKQQAGISTLLYKQLAKAVGKRTYKQFLDWATSKYPEKTEASASVDTSKKIGLKDAQRILKDYGDKLEAVVGEDTGYVGDHGVTYTRNNKRKVLTVDGEFWNHLGFSKTKLNSLIKAVEQLTAMKAFNKLSKAQQDSYKELTALTIEDLDNAEEFAGQASEATFSSRPILGSASVLDIDMKPAIIADKIVVDGVSDKFIAAEIAKTVNYIKKNCK